MSGALDGIRILDLSAMITGPLATMLLADQGAEVIKVEPPGQGDVMRALGTERGGIAAFFANCNRGKRSIVLDLKEERGRDVVKKLAETADVFVQNFRPGVIERLGLDAETLRAGHPELIYASISAFGHEGPESSRPAYDHILQGVAGFAGVQGNALTGPQYVRNALCDKSTAYTVSQGITAALLARARTGAGQHLRISMLDASLSFIWPDGMANQTILEDDVTLKPPMADSYVRIESLDGYLALAAVTDAHWHGLFRAVEKPELAEDPRFVTAEARSANLVALLAELGGGKVAYTTAEAVERLQAEDVPAGPVLSPDEVPDFPQTVATGAIPESLHPVMGRIRQPRPPVRFEGTPSGPSRHAPSLGEHTDEILAECGLRRGEIQELREKGIAA